MVCFSCPPCLSLFTLQYPMGKSLLPLNLYKFSFNHTNEPLITKVGCYICMELMLKLESSYNGGWSIGKIHEYGNGSRNPQGTSRRTSMGDLHIANLAWQGFESSLLMSQVQHRYYFLLALLGLPEIDDFIQQATFQKLVQCGGIKYSLIHKFLSLNLFKSFSKQLNEGITKSHWHNSTNLDNHLIWPMWPFKHTHIIWTFFIY